MNFNTILYVLVIIEMNCVQVDDAGSFRINLDRLHLLNVEAEIKKANHETRYYVWLCVFHVFLHYDLNTRCSTN